MTPDESPSLPELDIDLTIAIVTWNSRADIGSCLDSLPAAAAGLSWRAVLVDNDSPDLTADWVAEHYPDVHLIRNALNLGFGAAHNEAMSSGVGRYHLVLNPDTVCHPGSIKTLVRYLQDNPQVAFVGPQVRTADGSLYPSCRAFPTPGALLFRNALLSRLFPRNPYTRGYLMVGTDHNRLQDAGWLSGSALMVSRVALEEIGLLDERFFMYCEDMDWCKRAHDLGWGVVYNPAAIIMHRKARSTDQRVPAMIIEHHRSMWMFYSKHQRQGQPAWWSVGAAAVIAGRAMLILSGHALDVIVHRLRVARDTVQAWLKNCILASGLK